MDIEIISKSSDLIRDSGERVCDDSRTDIKKNELKPWQKKEWCIPEADSEFVCKMEDVLKVYEQPYNPQRPVVCMDEMMKQLTKEIRLSLPVSPGTPERYDTEYVRNGTSNIFIHFEPLTGRSQVKVTDRRTKIDWAHFIKELVDQHYREAEKIILVMDNLNTHSGASLYEAFPPQEARRLLDKLEIHYTPKHGSWLNMAEIALSHLSRQCLDRRIPDKQSLIKETDAWLLQQNQNPAPFNWQFSVDNARVKLKSLYPTLSLIKICESSY